MRFPIIIFLFSILQTNLIAQLNVLETGRLSYGNARTTDVWGYVDNLGNEYALVGIDTGMSIVDVTDPANPVELHFIEGPASGWRDIKVWGDHAYCTNEDSAGLLIVDMSDVQNQIDYIYWTGDSIGLETAHNIFIDENGVGYIVGANIGSIFVDLTGDPMNPVLLGRYNRRYVHDVYVRNDTMYTAEINNGEFSVVDVQDKSLPVVLASVRTPSEFTHNLWLSDDGNTLFTTDEVDGAFITAYDISDLSNITEIDRYQSSPGEEVMVHNTFVVGDHIITSYYADGIVVNDVTDPANMIEVGNFDTSPIFDGSGSVGCWGVYPYLPSGAVLVSDMQNGLFVLDVDYVQAAYLEGTITDSATGAPINGVSIAILPDGQLESTALDGSYKTGFALSGTYDVQILKPGYFPKTLSVQLTQGQTEILDAVLAAKPPFQLVVTVNDDLGNPIENADLFLRTNEIQLYGSTNTDGEAIFDDFFEDIYDLYVGKWGYVTGGTESSLINVDDASLSFTLSTGYYDDFSLDLGWLAIGSTFLGGSWERGNPDGTFFDDSPLFNPENDMPGDLSDMCYFTGNDGFTDFVAGGQVTLTSPKFDLTGIERPFILFDSWFVNLDSVGVGNDSMIARISNDSQNVIVKIYRGELKPSGWVPNAIDVAEHIQPGAGMRIQFSAFGDLDQATFDVDVTEAAIDRFRIIDSVETVGLEETPQEVAVRVSPNPTRGQITVSVDQGHIMNMQLISVDGRLIEDYRFDYGFHQKHYLNIKSLKLGIYFLQITHSKGKSVERILRID